MLSAIASALGGKIIDSFFERAEGALKAYFNKQISMEEMRAKLVQALVASFADIEKSHAELVAKTFESFHQTLRTSPRMQTAWLWVVYSQLAVLLWHQAGIPFLTFLLSTPAVTFKYPSSGSTVEWAYALLGFMFGAGAMLLRTGPAAGGGLLDKLKTMIK